MENSRQQPCRISHILRANLCIALVGSVLVFYFLVLATSLHNDEVARVILVAGYNRSAAYNRTAVHKDMEDKGNNVTENPDNGTRRTMGTFKSRRPCTFGLFREVNAHDHYFPHAGKWVKDATGLGLRYHLEACEFKYPLGRLPKSFMDRCFAKSNLSSLLIMGDSTASRYYNAVFNTSGGECNRIRGEHYQSSHFVPDKKYFTDRVPAEIQEFVSVKFRFCSGCNSKIDACERTSGLNTRFEYIAQTMILDDSIEITFPEFSVSKTILDKIWSITSQEFIFRYVLNQTYPQVFLIFLPFAHAKQNIRLDRLAMEIRYYKDLVEHYFPKNAKLIYMPAYSEFAKKPDNTVWRGHLFEGMLAQEKIRKMNDILYQVLEPDLLKENGRIFSFLDVFEASVSRAEWSTDGVHMFPIWYENVMTMFWETFCNSVILDEF